MTRDRFFDWAQAQEERYEFDGFQPVAMTGGTANHNRICQNVWFALRTRLGGTGCEAFGPDAGVATVGDAVRYPDALVTCTTFAGSSRLIPGAVVVFEVISPTSGRADRIDKVLEYRAVPSIRRYVILEHLDIGLTVFSRADGAADWTATTLTADKTLDMPELGIAVPVQEFYKGVDLPGTPPVAGLSLGLIFQRLPLRSGAVLHGQASRSRLKPATVASMNVALRQPSMTRDQFFDWAQAQEGRYEFDGFQPVAMTGGSNNHSIICQNIWSALRTRLRGSGCNVLGPDAGLATVGDAVRYPDALVTCAKIPGAARLVPDVVVVFEVLSPSSGRLDRINKLIEYRAVPSIRRYVILEYRSADLTVLSRANGAADWTATALTSNDTLDISELGISVPVHEFYEDVDLSGTPSAAEA